MFIIFVTAIVSVFSCASAVDEINVLIDKAAIAAKGSLRVMLRLLMTLNYLVFFMPVVPSQGTGFPLARLLENKYFAFSDIAAAAMPLPRLSRHLVSTGTE